MLTNKPILLGYATHSFPESPSLVSDQQPPQVCLSGEPRHLCNKVLSTHGTSQFGGSLWDGMFESQDLQQVSLQTPKEPTCCCSSQQSQRLWQVDKGSRGMSKAERGQELLQKRFLLQWTVMNRRQVLSQIAIILLTDKSLLLLPFAYLMKVS